MGRMIVKPNREKNLYVLWSSITDTPLMWGKRRHFLKWAKDPANWDVLSPDQIEAMLDRADATSSSSRIFPESWDEDFSIIYAGYGYIMNSEQEKLLEVLELKDVDTDDPRALALLHPFE